MIPAELYLIVFRRLLSAIRRRLRRPTGNKLQQDSAAAATDSVASSSSSSISSSGTAIDMETSASVNKFKLRNRVATRKSGTEASSDKHAVAKDGHQDDGGYKVITATCYWLGGRKPVAFKG